MNIAAEVGYLRISFSCYLKCDRVLVFFFCILDEDDRHKCGRCQSEFTSLEEFVQHKLQKLCQRPQDATAAASPASFSRQHLSSAYQTCDLTGDQGGGASWINKELCRLK